MAEPPTDSEFVERLRSAHAEMASSMAARWNRSVPLGDLVGDRWARARACGFGEGSSVYDSALIIGDVRVGRNTWIGPGVILDGSGGLEIGDNCSICAGVQVYTHNTVEWATSMGERAAVRAPVRIGSGCYIGPQSVVSMGVEIGDRTVVGALSLVNRSLPAGVRAWGVPARVQPAGGGR
jgi:acetyltransferase-like isoleucine patch superfamily enzyme